MSDEPDVKELIERAVPTPIKSNESDRITINTQIAFQQPDADPVGVSLIGQYDQKTSGEDAYRRRMLIGPEWKEVDIGWCDDPLMVIIDNQIPRRQVNPTAEEKAKDADRVVLVCFNQKEPAGHVIIPRGMSLPVMPSPAVKMWVCCPTDTIKVPLTVVQRCPTSSS